MRVEVQLFATLVSFLPPESRNGAATLEIPEDATVHDVTDRLGIPGDFDRVSLVNGQKPSPSARCAPATSWRVLPLLAGGRS